MSTVGRASKRLGESLFQQTKVPGQGGFSGGAVDRGLCVSSGMVQELSSAGSWVSDFGAARDGAFNEQESLSECQKGPFSPFIRDPRM